MGMRTPHHISDCTRCQREGASRVVRIVHEVVVVVFVLVETIGVAL